MVTLEKRREELKSTQAEVVALEQQHKAACTEAGADLSNEPKSALWAAGGIALIQSLPSSDERANLVRQKMREVELLTGELHESVASEIDIKILKQQSEPLPMQKATAYALPNRLSTAFASRPSVEDADMEESDAIEFNFMGPNELDGEVGNFEQLLEEAAIPTCQDPVVWKSFLESQNAIAVRNNAAMQAAAGVRNGLKNVLGRVYSATGSEGKLFVKRAKVGGVKKG